MTKYNERMVGSIPQI